MVLGSPLKARYGVSERLNAEQLRLMGADSSRALLDQFVVLSYADTATAETSRIMLTANKGIANVTKNLRYRFSATPNDPGFQSGPFGTGFMNYQWGLQQMSFPAAWDTVKGNAYVAVLDTGIQLDHSDLSANFKPQLSAIHSAATTLEDEFEIPFQYALARGHGTHVAGIIAANSNNGYGVSGGCWNCSLMIQKISDRQTGIDLNRVANGITAAVDRGAQVINMSFGNYVQENCAASTSFLCTSLSYATSRSSVLVAAAGNNVLRRDDTSQPDSGDVQQPANQSAVIPVGALQPTAGARGYLWTETRGTYDEFFSGSSTGSSMLSRGVVAPGMDVFSTVFSGENWNALAFCGDNVAGSSTLDGFGPCTGTSMAAPHISALVGLMRSVNPWVTSNSIGVYLRAAGDNAASPNQQVGYGQPNAATAVQSMVGTNAQRLIPLLSMYSSSAQNHFYTSVPQMATAAYFGTLRPRVTPTTYAFIGTQPSGFGSVPDGSITGIYTGAQAYIINTYVNPIAANPLVPLIRLSYKCGDPVPTPNAACTANANHVDHALSTNTNNEITGSGGFIYAGYKIDGVEGYIYDAAAAQPVGTERLLRAYNPTLDDHAVFPLREQCNMAAQGYTLDVTNLGYVYPVTTYPAPPPLAVSLFAVKSRKSHGATGIYDLPLDVNIPICGLVSVESRTGASGHQIVFQFSASVSGPFTSTVTDSSGASLGTATASTVGSEVIVDLSGVADNRRAKITVINNSNGMVIGTVSMGFLIGDGNSSGSVNSSDISAVKFRSGQVTDATNFRFDLDTSGAIGSSDISMVKARSGWILPN